VLAFLLDHIQEAALKVGPVDPALSNCLEPDASIPERLDPIPTLDRIESAKTILVPTKDDLEVSGLSIVSHPEKGRPTLGVVAGDRFVGILPDDLVTMLLGILDELGPLSRNRLLLPTGTHSQIENRF